MSESVLRVNNLHTHFFLRQGVLKAVNGASFELKRGSVLGIIGESGAGKSVTALSILSLVPYPGRIVEGEVYFDERDLLSLEEEEFRQIRGKDITIIFQDPTKDLNPLMRIGKQVDEIITSHLEGVSQTEARERSLKAMERVGLSDPERIASQYPNQLSGGMHQRVVIAIAMMLNPRVLIADEPISYLDTTLQAEILAQIEELKEHSETSIIFITHDLGVIAQMAQEVAVMYAGSIVEWADTVTLFQRPVHPYTLGLMQAIPRIDAPELTFKPLQGIPPSLIDLPNQCAFIPRCNKARNECRLSPRPPPQEIDSNHTVACYNPIRYDWS